MRRMFAGCSEKRRLTSGATGSEGTLQALSLNTSVPSTKRCAPQEAGMLIRARSWPGISLVSTTTTNRSRDAELIRRGSHCFRRSIILGMGRGRQTLRFAAGGRTTRKAICRLTSSWPCALVWCLLPGIIPLVNPKQELGSQSDRRYKVD